MKVTDKKSFAIIGAGPAGSSTAFHLARDGHNVVIIDPQGPHEKVCGGGVPIKCLERFSYLYENFEPAKELYDNILMSFDGEDLCRVPMVGGMGVFSRREHDSHIFNLALAAGARYRAARFKNCQQVGNIWQIETDAELIEADFIIGADGATSRVRNLLAEKLPREAYFKGHDYLIKTPKSLPLHVGFDKSLDGYLWVFPRKENCSVGIVDFSENRQNRLRLLDDYLKRFGIEENEIMAKRSAIIPSLRRQDIKRLEVSGDSWALVGDAAGFAEPLTGEGIYYAIYSGELFSRCLREGLSYEKVWKKEFRQVVEEANISRVAYGMANKPMAKFLLRRSSLLRYLTGLQLAARKSGRYYRFLLLLSTPLILFQALLSSRQDVA